MGNVLHSSRTCEWHTPPDIINRARRVLGEIDLDPASSPQANKTIQAKRIYTIAEDGLRQPIYGRVWCNPPYGTTGAHRSTQGLWTAKILGAWEAGDMEAGILLVNAVPDRQWFQDLWRYPLCFTKYRIRFIDADGVQQSQPTHGNVLCYLGRDLQVFAEEFCDLGTIVVPGKGHSPCESFTKIDI